MKKEYINLVFRNSKIVDGEFKFIDSKSVKVDIFDSDFFIDDYEKDGGDIFDDIDEETDLKEVYRVKKENYIISKNKKVKNLYDINNLYDLKKYIYSNLENTPVEFQYLEGLDEYGEYSSICHYYKYADLSMNYIKKYPKMEDIFISSEPDINEDYNTFGINLDKELYYSRPLFYLKENKKRLLSFISQTIYVYSLLDIINTSKGLNNIISLISKDNDSKNYYYYGFIEKFFPFIQSEYLENILRSGGFSYNYSFFKKDFVENSLYEKLDAIKNVSNSSNSFSKKNKSIEKIEIDNVLIKFDSNRQNDNNIHLLKLFNSIDLKDKVVKVSLYIKHRNIFIEKIKKEYNLYRTNEHETRSRKRYHMPDSKKKNITHKKDSYITFQLKNETNSSLDEITLYYDKSIEATIHNYNNAKSHDVILKRFKISVIEYLYNYLSFYLGKDVDLYLDKQNVKSYCYCKNMSFSISYLITPDISSRTDIKNICKEFEILDEYKLSNSESIKDSVFLFLSRDYVNSFKYQDNDFLSKIEMFQTGDAMFVSKENIMIQPRLNDIYVKFNNIKVSYHQAYIKITDALLYNYDKMKNQDYEEEELSKNAKRIKILKQADPLLFDATKDKDLKFSRLCQSKQQPIIISKDLAQSNRYKNKSVKFWNFTKGRPEYYACDSKEYPHLKFLTGSHPNNFCLPCCKKKLVDDADGSISSYKDKHLACLDKFSYTKESIKQPNANRYISLYSCKTNIEENRLMKLSATMKKLFSIAISNSKAEDLNSRLDNIYIFGITPFEHVIKSHILRILSIEIYGDILSCVDVILLSIDILSKNKYIFYSIEEGSLIGFFTNCDSFIDFLYSVLDSSSLAYKSSDNTIISDEWSDLLDWDSIFMSIFYLYGYRFVNIIETDNETINDSNIDIIDNNLYEQEDNNYKYIITASRINIDGSKSIYPLIHTDIQGFYTSDSPFEHIKIGFNNNSSVILSLSKIKTINQSLNDDSNLTIDAEFIIKIENNGYSVEELYINEFKEVYAIKLSKSKNSIVLFTDYIDVLIIKKNRKANVNTKGALTDLKSINMSLDFLKKFCKEINATISDVFVSKDYINGCVLNSKYCVMFNPISINSISDISFDSANRLKYLDYLSYDSQQFFSHNRIKKAIYNVNMYEILINHINNKLSKKTNEIVRKKVKDIFIDNIKSYKLDREEISKCFGLLQTICNNEDSHVIIYSFISSFRFDKKKSFNIINKVLNSLDFMNSVKYSFDKEIEFNIDTDYVDNLLSDIIEVRKDSFIESRDEELDLNMDICSGKNSYYCLDGKFLLPEEKYKDILRILVRDLKNDYKKKYILNYNKITTTKKIDTELYIQKNNNSDIIVHEL